MSLPFNITNPGFFINAQLTSGEAAFVTELAGLSPSDGDIFVYRTAGSAWVLEAKPTGGSNPAMADITDTTFTTLTDGDVLTYDSATGDWINQAPSGGGTDDQTAAEVPFTPSGNIVATEVQAAIEELDGEKLGVDALSANLILYPTTTASDIGGYAKLASNIADPDYDVTAANVSTGAITTTSQLISSLASEAGIIEGELGVLNNTVIGNIRRTAGSGTATFYFEVYKRSSGGTETLLETSANTLPVSAGTYVQFSAAGLINNGPFLLTDRIVLKFYGNRIAGGSDPTYDFQFGGNIPTRALFPLPLTAVPTDAHNELSGLQGGTTDEYYHLTEAEDTFLNDITATAEELNLLDGVTATTAELNFVDGVTSNIQDQLNSKVTGPASATDNAIARFDATTGKLVQNSGVIISDTNNITGIATITASNIVSLGDFSGANFNSPDGNSYVGMPNGATGNIGLYPAGAGGLVTVAGKLIPDSNFARDLGSSSRHFQDFFISRMAGQDGMEFVNSGNLSEEFLSLEGVASAVNYVKIFNSATGNAVPITAVGTDTNISLNLVPKGTGEAQVSGDRIVTEDATQTLAGKTLASPKIDLAIEPAVDDTYTGIASNDINAGATVAQWEVVYLDATPDWNLTDASAEATAGPVQVALATEAGTAASPLNVLFSGIARNDAWTWTAGGAIYMSETAGAMTQTAPTTTDSVTRVLGYALSDDAIYFNPSNDWVVHV